jgi:NAD(P)-dependent dehydrogenase (short-subunit alcohol dehydrogenase family)
MEIVTSGKAQKMKTRLSGKRVLITGASRGIGAAAAHIFSEAGARLGLAARDGAAISALAAELGGGALALPCDVAAWPEVEAAAQAMERAFGGVDILINNAGVIEPIARLDAADPLAWGRLIDINLKGAYHGIRAVLPGMAAQGGGTVITVSSGAAHRAMEGWSAYCSSKAGAAMLTEALHLEFGGKGIRAMGLSPGTVAPEMQVKIRASGINPVSRLDPSAHIPAEWPARALAWMCGAEADDLLGTEVSLRDEGIRRRVGLIA